MLSFLKQPYPARYTPATMFRMAIVFGLVIGSFLLIFKPFGIHNLPGNGALISAGVFGLVTFLFLCFNALIIVFFKRYFDEDHWTFGKEVLWMGYTFVAIGILNYYTGVTVLHYDSSFMGLMDMMWQTIVVGFIPFMSLTFLRQMRLLKQHLAEARKMNSHLHHQENESALSTEFVHIESENEREEGVKLHPENLLFIESIDNYIDIYWTEGEHVKKAVLRSTLKRLEEKFEYHPNFFRCHRAFIINPSKILEVEGNSQGYRILLHKTLPTVPVARGKQAAFKQLLAEA